MSQHKIRYKYNWIKNTKYSWHGALTDWDLTGARSAANDISITDVK